MKHHYAEPEAPHFYRMPVYCLPVGGNWSHIFLVLCLYMTYHDLSVSIINSDQTYEHFNCLHDVANKNSYFKYFIYLILGWEITVNWLKSACKYYYNFIYHYWNILLSKCKFFHIFMHYIFMHVPFFKCYSVCNGVIFWRNKLFG